MASPQPTVTVVAQVPRLPPRPPDSNKGTFGRVLVVAGSRGMSGAAVLCARGARPGAARPVRRAVPASILPLVAPATPCYLTAPLPDDGQGRLAATAREELTALVRANTV